MKTLDRNGNELKLHDSVLWYDPSDESTDLERVFEIYDISGELVCISDKYGESEVFADELELVEL